MADSIGPTVYTPNVLWLDGGTPEMVAAVREAQRTFDEYRTALQATPDAVVDSGVKVFFPSRGDPAAGEHLWVDEVAFNSGGLVGTLRNDPSLLPGLANGGRVPFTVSRVSDWFFVAGGAFHGGFTLKLLYRHYTPQQFADCVNDPPACYLADWYAQQLADTAVPNPP